MKRCVALIAVVLLAAGLFLFARTQKREAVYTLTQFSQANGAQGMCYALTDDAGHLVLIDGGFDLNSELVLNLIIDHNSHVDAWIITHSHQDHVSVFNNLSAGGFDFTIDTIYCPDLDRDHYAAVAAGADGGFEYYEAFRENLKRWEHVQFVHAGEEYEVIGLPMKILNAYEKGEPLFETDPENAGSLMFTLTGKEKKLLFCGDVTRKVAKSLKKRWKEELKADILQVGHHGVGFCPDSKFNLYVEPEIAFLDAPRFLPLSNEESAGFRQDLLDAGVTVYDFDTAPNTVEFR